MPHECSECKFMYESYYDEYDTYHGRYHCNVTIEDVTEYVNYGGIPDDYECPYNEHYIGDIIIEND